VKTTAQVVFVGTAALDSIALVEELPGEDARVEALDLAIVGGGNASTAAVACARLGVDVEFAGVVGDDEYGTRVIAQLDSEGVGTRHVIVDPDATTPCSLVLVSRASGKRAIVTRPATRSPGVPTGFDWVHVDKSGYPGLRANAARSSKISVDDGNEIPGIELAAMTLYVPTLTVLRGRFPGLSIPGALTAAREAGASTVVATAGSQGAYGADASGLYFVPGVRVPVVSTLGAGDVFHGALLAATVLGLALPEAIRLANVTAAMSCRALDGRSGIPTLSEVEAALSFAPPADRISARSQGAPLSKTPINQMEEL